MKKTSPRKITAVLTSALFVLTQVVAPLPGLAASVGAIHESPLQHEIQDSPSFQIDLPPDLGTIQSLHAGSGPTLIHIQDAHGNYEAQKKIAAILEHLKKVYGIKLLLLEGSATSLDPKLVRVFPRRMDWSREVADELTKDAWMKAAELFLLDSPETKALGIEDLGSYVSNGRSFVSVLTQQEKTEGFLRDMDMQIERLTGPYLNKDLRAFLRRIEAYEAKQLPILEWLNELKVSAKKYLEIDLTDPVHQIDWPTLIRIFKLSEFESQIDMKAFTKERDEFLKSIHPFFVGARRAVPLQETYNPIQSLLLSPISHHQLPDPETGILFEKMVEALPRDFNYEAYPNVRLFIGHLIFQSEIHGDRLMKELDRLTDLLSGKLAQTKEENKILGLLKDHRLLKRLFALELTPDDYEKIVQGNVGAQFIAPSPEQQGVINHAPTGDLRPSSIIHRFMELNGNKRVKEVEFKHLDAIDALYETALEFYAGVKARDTAMIENIEKRLTETGETKAAVITGGFHAGPFNQFFSNKNYNYVLIAPKISNTDGRDAYIKTVLETSTRLALYFVATPAVEAESYEVNLDPVVAGIVRTAQKVAMNRGARFQEFVEELGEEGWAGGYGGVTVSRGPGPGGRPVVYTIETRTPSRKLTVAGVRVKRVTQTEEFAFGNVIGSQAKVDRQIAGAVKSVRPEAREIVGDLVKLKNGQSVIILKIKGDEINYVDAEPYRGNRSSVYKYVDSTTVQEIGENISIGSKPLKESGEIDYSDLSIGQKVEVLSSDNKWYSATYVGNTVFDGPLFITHEAREDVPPELYAKRAYVSPAGLVSRFVRRPSFEAQRSEARAIPLEEHVARYNAIQDAAKADSTYLQAIEELAVISDQVVLVDRTTVQNSHLLIDLPIITGTVEKVHATPVLYDRRTGELYVYTVYGDRESPTVTLKAVFRDKVIPLTIDSEYVSRILKGDMVLLVPRGRGTAVSNDVKAVAIDWMAIYNSNKNALIPGAVEFLKGVKAQDMKVWILADGRETAVRTKLDEFGLTALIDGLRGRETDERVNNLKTQQLLDLQQQYQLGPNQIAVIGSSVQTLRQGRLAGVVPIGVVRDTAKREEFLRVAPALLVDDLANPVQLLNFLLQRGADTVARQAPVPPPTGPGAGIPVPPGGAPVTPLTVVSLAQALSNIPGVPESFRVLIVNVPSTSNPQTFQLRIQSTGPAPVGVIPPLVPVNIARAVTERFPQYQVRPLQAVTGTPNPSAILPFALINPTAPSVPTVPVNPFAAGAANEVNPRIPIAQVRSLAQGLSLLALFLERVPAAEQVIIGNVNEFGAPFQQGEIVIPINPEGNISQQIVILQEGRLSPDAAPSIPQPQPGTGPVVLLGRIPADQQTGRVTQAFPRGTDVEGLKRDVAQFLERLQTQIQSPLLDRIVAQFRNEVRAGENFGELEASILLRIDTLKNEGAVDVRQSATELLGQNVANLIGLNVNPDRTEEIVNKAIAALNVVVINADNDVPASVRQAATASLEQIQQVNPFTLPGPAQESVPSLDGPDDILRPDVRPADFDAIQSVQNPEPAVATLAPTPRKEIRDIEGIDRRPETRPAPQFQIQQDPNGPVPQRSEILDESRRGVAFVQSFLAFKALLGLAVYRLRYEAFVQFLLQNAPLLEAVEAQVGVKFAQAAVAEESEPGIVEGIIGPDDRIRVAEQASLDALKGNVNKTLTPADFGTFMYRGYWLDQLKDPQTLYNTLKDLRYQRETVGFEAPVVAVAQTKDSFMGEVRPRLENLKSGLSPPERAEVQALLKSLELGELIRFVEPADVAGYVAAQSVETGIIVLGAEGEASIDGATNFMLRKSILRNAKDRTVISTFAIRGAFAARFVMNVKDPQEQYNLLAIPIQTFIFPGAQVKFNGRIEFVSVQAYLAALFLGRQLIAVAA